MAKLNNKPFPPVNSDITVMSALLSDLIPLINVYEVSYDPASVSANSINNQTVAVAGITTKDIIFVNPPSLTVGLALVSYRVASDNNVQLTFYNSTGSSINEGSGIYKIIAFRN